MKKRLLLLLFCVMSLSLFSQNGDIDRLKSEAKANPSDLDLRIRLIEAYNQASKAENALIELMEIERANSDNSKVLQLKGESLLQLEKLLPALQTLEDSYFITPEDRTLKSIALIDYAMGNTKRGEDILSRVQKRDPNLTDFYYENYKRFYLKGKEKIANACMTILQEFAGTKLDVYFPQPQINIFSPTERLATENDFIAVLFEVKHVHPVSSVSVDGKSVYQKADEKTGEGTYAFSKAFKEKIDLHDGNNKIKIMVNDIYGKSSEKVVEVDQLSFKRPHDYHGLYSDSLFKITGEFLAHVPDEIYQGKKMYRLLAAGALSGPDSAKFFESSLFLFDWLTDSALGLVNPDQAKLVLDQKFTMENIMPLIDNWLYKDSNIETRTILFFGGAWDNSPESWLLRTYDGQTVDVKAILTKLTRVPADRIIVILDGWQDADLLAWDSIDYIVKNSPIPMTVLLTKALKNSDLFTTSNVFASEEIRKSSGNSIVNLKNIQNYLPLMTSFGDTTHLSWEIAVEPMPQIDSTYQQVKKAFTEKLDKEKLTKGMRKAIDTYYNSWRHIDAINKYLKNETSAEDLYNETGANTQLKGDEK